MARTELTITQDKTGEVFDIDVVVTLSRRNLLALLHKLDMEGSARTIQNNDTYLNGVSTPGIILTLRCEDDDEHYSKRIEKYGVGSRPGEMHPDTEAFISGNRPI